MTLRELFDLHQAQLIDVRTPGEFVAGPQTAGPYTAINIPLQEFAQRFGEIDRHRPVIVVCAAGARSGQACSYLVQQGYTQVYNGVNLATVAREL